MNVLEELGDLWIETTGFDYVDRMMLFFYFTFSTYVFIYTLSQHLTDREASQVAPAFDALGYMLLFFLAWPVIRLVISRGHRRLVSYWGARGERA